MNPSHIAIRNPATVYILTLMLFIMGIMSYRSMPREAQPDIQIPLLIVSLPFPGASPEDVEALVTHKAEMALQNLDSLKEIKSTSAEGVSSIRLEFHLGFDVDDARVKVREKLDSIIPELPDDVEDPIITEINFSDTPMLMVNLAGDVGLVMLKEVAEDLKDDIEGIPGILEVNRAGGLEREIKVYVDPQKLLYYQLSLNQVVNAVERENTNIPGGTLTMGPTKYLIRVPGEFKSPLEINDVIIAAPGQQPIFVRDVARVEFGFREQTSHSRMDGQDSVSLVVIKRSGEHLLEIRDRIKKLVASYEGEYQGRIRFTLLADQGVFVGRIVRDLENNIITGFLLVFVTLLMVMGLRNSLFVAAAIPLSFLLTLICLEMLGFTLNFVVLFSLILALGMMVDNAIVVVENIFRHAQSGKGRVQSALEGISEVAVPVTTSTITTLVAFAPIIFMPGIPGEFMSYLPKTLIIALSSSLFVALVVNPVICATLMKQSGTGSQPSAEETQDEVRMIENSRWLLLYKKVLTWHLDRRWRVILATNVFFFLITGLYIGTTLIRKGVEFFPTTEPETATISIEAPTGTTLDISDGYTRQVEQMAAPFKQSIVTTLANVGQRQGGGSSEAGSTTSHLSYVKLEFPQWQDWKRRPSEVMGDIRNTLGGIPGAEVKLSQASHGPPTGPPVNIELRGNDFRQMRLVAEDIKRKIVDIPGLINLSDDFDRSRPEIRVIIDREKTARLGLDTRTLAMAVRTAFQGRKVSEYREGKDEYDIIVRLDEEFRLGPGDLERLYLNSPSGELVPLSEMARIDTGPSYGSIKHVGLDRVITISGDASPGFSGPMLLGQVRERLTEYVLPPGMSFGFTGENRDREEAQAYLTRSFFIALFLIFLVLVTQFNSVLSPFIILSSVVLSLMGVFIGLMIHQKPFSVMMGGIGVISLAGIVVNNAIVLIDFINQLRRRGYSRREAVVMAGMVRLRPVMLTAVTTILALIPVAAGMDIDFFRFPRVVVFGGEGGAFWMPMALAVIYGLSVATIMTLIWVPVLYSSIEDIRERFAGFFESYQADPSAALAGLKQSWHRPVAGLKQSWRRPVAGLSGLSGRVLRPEAIRRIFHGVPATLKGLSGKLPLTRRGKRNEPGAGEE